jgi:predicted RNase H-like HicB family nuclease
MTQLLERQSATQPSPVPKPVIAFFAAMRRILHGPEDERECVYEPEEAHTGRWNLRVLVTPDELDGGFIAECPDVPGAVSQGETEEEAVDGLVEAMQAIVEATMRESFHEASPDTYHITTSG